MKRCPKCNRRYGDDSLRFCLEDGTPLSQSLRESEAPPTEILPPRVAPTLKSSGPTIPSYLSGDDIRSQQRDIRRTNPVLTAGVIAIAMLLLALVGIAAYFVLRQSNANESAEAQRGSSPTVREGVTPSPNDRSGQSSSEPSRAVDEISTSNSQTGTPLKITASASSNRLAVQSNTYYPANAIDGKRSTAWIEGVDGAGIGEWIRFDFDREINLHRILFQPGYFKSPGIWAENNRLGTVTAYFSDGTTRDFNFPDRMESQKVDVGGVRTKSVRLVIKSVYYGTDPDTAISEVAFEWEP